MASATLARPFTFHIPRRRLFSTSISLNGRRRTNVLRLLPPSASGEHPEPPPYPYPPARWYKQQNKGLYGGVMIRYGNNVSEQNEIKTRRNWLPNIKHKQLFSEALGRRVKLKVSTRALRTIDKAGGLDEYLLGNSKPARIKALGPEGWNLRWAIIETLRNKQGSASDPKLQKLLQEMEGWSVIANKESAVLEATTIEMPAEEDAASTEEADEELSRAEQQIQSLPRRKAHMLEEQQPVSFLQRIRQRLR